MAKALDLDRLEGVTADTITDEQVRALLNANLDVLMDGEPDYHTRMRQFVLGPRRVRGLRRVPAVQGVRVRCGGTRR